MYQMHKCDINPKLNSLFFNDLNTEITLIILILKFSKTLQTQKN